MVFQWNDRTTVNLHIQYFAAIRELTGRNKEIVQVPDGISCEELLRILEAKYPESDVIMMKSRISVNLEFQESNCMLHDGDEIAFIPPVSGG